MLFVIEDECNRLLAGGSSIALCDGGIFCYSFAMARFFGKQSSYLLRGDFRNYLIGSLLLLFLLLLLYLFLKFGLVQSIGSPMVALILVGALIVIVKAAGPLLDFFFGKSRKFHRGWGGEVDIKNELKGLSDDFSVFRSIRFGNRGDVDLVVVGPTGVFAVEVKSHRGDIGFNGRYLTNNGRQFDKDFLGQAKGEAIQVSDFLMKKLGVKIFVKPILVFANYAKMNFGTRPVRDVFVIGKPFLLNLVQREPRANYPVPIQKIEDALKELTK